MYDFPEQREAIDALGARIVAEAAREGLSLPQLSHPTDLDAHWRAPDLTFSQICGFEVIADRYALDVVASPINETDRVNGPYYKSLVVVREDAPERALLDMRNQRLAINSWFSHSGCCALIPMVAPLAEGIDFFGEVFETGAHEHSLAAIREGRADLAAIDCITFAILERHRPRAVEGLRVLAESAAAPAPPYVTRLVGEDRRRLVGALQRAFSDRSLLAPLFVSGIEICSESDYAPMREFPQAGHRRSFLQLLHPAVRHL